MKYLAVILMLMSSPAAAHSWYPKECCNGSDQGGDCRPVPCSEISGWTKGVTWHGVKFSYEKIHTSPDGQCHVCEMYGIGYCVFLKSDPVS